MPIKNNARRIPEEHLAEQWFAFMHRLLGKLQAAFRSENKRIGLTKKDVAKRIGRDPAFVSRCFAGEQNMTVRTMHNLARGMGCRLDISIQPLHGLKPNNRPPHITMSASAVPITAAHPTYQVEISQ